MRTKKISLYGVFIALAFILSYIEMQIPAFVAIPGMKLGLTNLVVLMVLYLFDDKSAMFINIVRIIIVAILFGNAMSFAFSIVGGMLSTIMMIFLKRTKKFSTIGVSAAGGITHNIGQIITAMIVLGTKAIAWYLPVLWVTGIFSGVVIGLIGALVYDKLSVIIRQ
ncbi:Gx transporter family protein [Butyrivibrio sp. YAB3001]|uniref:Gx transporter family protein n=1 Tax=Butyrivibrio sp. YAB3001 TaxID=1520812 RepID=UPI0008F63A6F|nr:Gx transporter family protein [Butyrivibrio sp. YAB3001]SFB75414.1 heptaprenyl diphosphate synthase [Butyrivibrio sp. YAB3001]